MKWTILAFIFTLFGSPVQAGGNSVDFIWDQAPDITWATKIYIGTEPGVYSHSEDAGINTTGYHLENLQYNTTYYFSAAHYDQDGLESEYAPEIMYTSLGVPGITFNPLPEIDDSIKSYQIILTIPN